MASSTVRVGTKSNGVRVGMPGEMRLAGPLVSCVARLAVAGGAQIQAAGFEGALGHVCEWAGGGLGGGRGANGGWDDDRQVAEKAKQALRLIQGSLEDGIELAMERQKRAVGIPTLERRQ
ncbi:hypothetical protein C0992_006906 [Termitomyces sp. T32_za158]|nr:hypothetical protein C0992_006906 [Termitomyces sp. T32_za158]